MNILIKLTCLIGLVLAPILGGHAIDNAPVAPEGDAIIEMSEIDEQATSKEVQVIMSSEGEETVAKVTITNTENGKTNVEEKTIRGTKVEVEAQIQQL